MDLIWLKKDARLSDHGPLSHVLLGEAEKEKPFAVLYCYEPSQITHPTTHGSHVAFHNEGLIELEQSLQNLRGGSGGGLPILTIRIAEAVEAVHAIHNSPHGPIKRLFSHMETGHMASYARDRAMKEWCRKHDVTWKQFNQTGVIRGLKSRVDIESKPFAERWNQLMSSPQHEDPRTTSSNIEKTKCRLVSGLISGHSIGTVGVVSPSDPRLRLIHPMDRAARQRGGEITAISLLNSFLGTRGVA